MKILFENGSILTMEDDRQVEAVLVEDGRILAAGRRDDLPVDSGCRKVDLEGHAMLPAFLDAHGHFAAAANGLLQVPLGECANAEEICTRIQRFIQDNRIPAGEWVVAQGYDHNQLAEKRHPPLALLDQAAPNNPLLLQHSSGHVGMVNSAAIARLGLRADTPAPSGGKIGVEGGRLTGYLEENAFLACQKEVPMPGLDALLGACRRAQADYLAHGVVLAQEGFFAPQLTPMYQALLASGLLEMDLVGYCDIAHPELLDIFPDRPGSDCRFYLGGYKIFLDGSPQGRTAWMRQPYAGEESYCGYGVHTDGEVEAALRQAAGENRQILIHCNGDAACEQLLQAAERLRREGIDLAPLRPVIIHGQLMGLDQLPRASRLGFLVSFFPAHVYHWGDIHLANFGRERGREISPAASALREGLSVTFHQDTPVIPPDMLETVWCAVNRRTKRGETLGEAIGVEEALKAVTIRTAYQYGQEKMRGSIRPGKRADFVILDRNPLQVPPQALRELKVMATIAGGKCLFRAEKQGNLS